jgi:MmpS family membrane protein
MIMRMVALALATMVALTGCLSGQDDNGDSAAKPPAGGWPQPEDGQLTAKMCGLLTAEDYKPFDHKLMSPLAEQPSWKDSSNYLACSGILGEWLKLDLQPTTESAKIRYDNSLETRKDVIIVEKQKTILAQDLLPGADQSWFDYGQAPEGSTPTDFELKFRRGSLVAEVNLSDPNNRMKDPKAALLRLAGLVLERIPEVGKTDTGTTPKVRLEVKGTGKASIISHFTVDHKTETLKDVQLPWSVEVPMADHGDNQVPLTLNANSASGPMPVAISCAISVRGAVVKQEQRLSFAICNSMSTVK